MHIGFVLRCRTITLIQLFKPIQQITVLDVFPDNRARRSGSKLKERRFRLDIKKVVVVVVVVLIVKLVRHWNRLPRAMVDA